MRKAITNVQLGSSIFIASAIPASLTNWLPYPILFWSLAGLAAMFGLGIAVGGILRAASGESKDDHP